ncbi:hypothetical protein HZ994_18055 [Akkermansiaceae bacterium]|nr:hypothetical protein HZ994_18055 [Akkermansiaceae bacterium]
MAEDDQTKSRSSFAKGQKMVKLGGVIMYANNITKTNSEAEWAREKQVTAQFGLTHTILYNLRLEKKIRSVSLRGEGKQYGARLYNVASIREFLANQEAMNSNIASSRKASVTETLKP